MVRNYLQRVFYERWWNKIWQKTVPNSTTTKISTYCLSKLFPNWFLIVSKLFPKLILNFKFYLNASKDISTPAAPFWRQVSMHFAMRIQKFIKIYFNKVSLE